MTAPPAVRQQQYAAALDARTASDPDTYGPFTVHEYADSDWQMLDWCTQWPSAPASNPAGPPVPPGGRYSDVPCSCSAASSTRSRRPRRATWSPTSSPTPGTSRCANSVHVTAVGDTDDCAVRSLARSSRSPAGALPDRLVRCARQVPPVRALGRFPRALAPGAGARAVARAAALTVADLQDRWWNSYSGHGAGLRGGTWRYTGDRVVRFRLSGVRLLGPAGLRHRGLGPVRRDDDRLRSTSPRGHLAGSWDTRTLGAASSLSGRLHGRPVRISLPAP